VEAVTRREADRRDARRVLGVPASASAEEVARAYRRLARRFHPDVGGEAASAARFAEVAAAYDALTGDPPGGKGPVRVPVRRGGRRDVLVPVRLPLEAALRGATVPVRVDGEVLRVRLPAGADDGDVVRVPGRGPAEGDLRLRLQVEPDPRVRRAGDDLEADLRVRWCDAVLGARTSVPTPLGDVEVEVPAGTAHGDVLVVPGRGVPATGGALRVRVAVDVPTRLDDAERSAVQALAQVLRQPPPRT
jgi:curved DNA-binding protein